MSCEAKMWIDKTDGSWRGVHDGPCHILHEGTAYEMVETATAIETCYGRRLRWESRVYPDNEIGLVGWGW